MADKTFRQTVEEIADEMIATCCGDNCIGAMPCDKCSAWMLFNKAIQYGLEQQRDADMAWLPAHDSEVAKQAVKEFAEQLIADGWPSDPKMSIAHIRAMAEGKE